jgi:hypothetical protein
MVFLLLILTCYLGCNSVPSLVKFPASEKSVAAPMQKGGTSRFDAQRLGRVVVPAFLPRHPAGILSNKPGLVHKGCAATVSESHSQEHSLPHQYVTIE